MSLNVTTDVAFPTNIPGTLLKSTTNPVVDNIFVYLDGTTKWERVFDSGQKKYYASWLKISSAPIDLTTTINTLLADARVSIFVVDSDISINSVVNAGGKVIEFTSGIVSGTGSINNADIRARYNFTFLSGTVSLTNCTFSSYVPRFITDGDADIKNIILYYNTNTSKHRIKNGSTWYDIITSIAQVTADSLQGDGSIGSPIRLDNDSDSPGNNKVYRTNGSGAKGWLDFPAASASINTQFSISGDGSIGTPAQLVNDELVPGLRKYYGTDGSGTKGFFALSDGSVLSTNSLQGNGLSGTALQLDGDVDVPGSTYYYGTNNLGVKGFYAVPLQVTADSLQGDGTAGSPIKLDNDNNTPGNNKVYRTDGSGIKGWADFPAASSSINTQYSVSGDGSIGSPAQLVNDALAPGNSKYYGTDGAGSKGFYTLPTVTNTVVTSNSLNGDGSGGSPIQLDGDNNTPGNNYYYGTNGSGTKGWYGITSDANNYTVSTNMTDGVLTTTRNGLTNLTASFNTSLIPEGSRLYYTNSRVHSTISATGTGLSYNGSGTFQNTAPDQTVTIASGTGISATGTYPNFNITNTAPDQVVSITGSNGNVVTGTYPNFNVAAPSAVTGFYAAKGVLTVAGGFNFCYVKGVGGSFEISDKVLKIGHATNDDQRTITINATLYIDTFNTGTWTAIATIPTGFRPSGLITFPMSELVPGLGNPSTTPLRGSDATTGIINGCVYSGCACYIDPNDGVIYARIQTISSIATLGGLSVIVLPINVTYFINVGV